ncbi:MAG TPA: DUF5615 family PIN-like protein, partial [Thermomicrobiaceae bacterium]|nr:DUF5615 family PIN-like protein [Thermomicrobiaceae bacterium]
ELWPPTIAVALRRRGHDVVAVAERAELRGQPDAMTFAVAQAEGRAVLTESVIDFLPLAAERLARGDAHAGLVLTSRRRFPRSDPRTLGRLVNALDALLSSRADAVDREYWLG